MREGRGRRARQAGGGHVRDAPRVDGALLGRPLQRDGGLRGCVRRRTQECLPWRLPHGHGPRRLWPLDLHPSPAARRGAGAGGPRAPRCQGLRPRRPAGRGPAGLPGRLGPAAAPEVAGQGLLRPVACARVGLRHGDHAPQPQGGLRQHNQRRRRRRPAAQHRRRLHPLARPGRHSTRPHAGLAGLCDLHGEGPAREHLRGHRRGPALRAFDHQRASHRGARGQCERRQPLPLGSPPPGVAVERDPLLQALLVGAREHHGLFSDRLLRRRRPPQRRGVLGGPLLRGLRGQASPPRPGDGPAPPEAAVLAVRIRGALARPRVRLCRRRDAPRPHGGLWEHREHLRWGRRRAQHGHHLHLPARPRRHLPGPRSGQPRLPDLLGEGARQRDRAGLRGGHGREPALRAPHGHGYPHASSRSQPQRGLEVPLCPPPRDEGVDRGALVPALLAGAREHHGVLLHRFLWRGPALQHPRVPRGPLVRARDDARARPLAAAPAGGRQAGLQPLRARL
mmetsp:Transcript_144527/g.448770  ORF Transcript_144527/g.448770 Transcript_144527/m.448770 type:complete len:508 (+) Transcript_144527:322-1845(+)